MTEATPPEPPPTQNARAILTGLWTSLPIVLGYLPIAFAFGVAARGVGLSLAEAVALSLILYSGGAQFVALALVGSGAPLLVSVFTLGAMGLRHVLYGPALMRRAGPDARRDLAWAWAWGLTDEVFGTALGALARGQRYSQPFMFGLGLGAYAAWVLGTAAGAYAGSSAFAGWPAVEAGLGFMLPALFLALLLSLLSRDQVPVLALAATATVLVSLLWSATAGLLAGMIAGAAAGALLPGRRHAD